MAPAVDRISNLPNNVTETILMYLPLRDAVRTSILSRYWRYEWNTLPKLLFDENCVPRQEGSANEMYDQKLVKIVNQVLLVHHGPIRTFKLSVNRERSVDIDRWILLLSRNGIKELTLKKLEGESYKVPSCLYLCEELNYLCLYNCTIIVPPSVKGFRSLTKLVLQYANFPNNGLANLISICPLMRILLLKYINGCDHLNICALKLIGLAVEVNFEDLCFENTPLLAVLSINLRISKYKVVADGAICKLVQLFGSLPSLSSLVLHGTTLLFLSQGNIPIKLPTACRLKYLLINLNFEDMQQMLAAVCIFRSSPILQNLCIKVSADKNNTATNSIDDFWEPREDSNCLFSRLQTVEVTNFTGTKSELKFVEFVLANAPVLAKVRIQLKQRADGALTILTEMTRFRRVSSTAEIVFQA